MLLYSGLKKENSNQTQRAHEYSSHALHHRRSRQPIEARNRNIDPLVSAVFLRHGRSHERQANNSHQGTATENVQITCSRDEDSLDGQKVFRVVDEMPIYAGGMGKYFELIKKDIKLPDDDKMWQHCQSPFLVGLIQWPNQPLWSSRNAPTLYDFGLVLLSADRLPFYITQRKYLNRPGSPI